MIKPYSSPSPPDAVPLPGIDIQAPANGAIVGGAFQANGSVSNGVLNLMITLSSSSPGVAAVNMPADGSSGFWVANFNVNPADFPNNSTLTAALVGIDVSTSETIRIMALVPVPDPNPDQNPIPSGADRLSLG